MPCSLAGDGNQKNEGDDRKSDLRLLAQRGRAKDEGHHGTSGGVVLSGDLSSEQPATGPLPRR